MDEDKGIEVMIAQKQDKEKRIKKEIRRLNSLFRDMPKDTKKVAKSLIENAAFMSVTLQDLQEHINLHGTTDRYQNGENQWGYKKSPQVEIHISMTRNLNATMNQLTGLLPKEDKTVDKDDGFDQFINTRTD